MSSEESLKLLAKDEMPERYLRNQGTVGIQVQTRLLQARVAVVGAGGLGGTVIELLARMGIGYLKIIDGDTFARHNFNRQILSNELNIGVNKAHVAAERVAAINSDVQVEAVHSMLDEKNAEDFLDGLDVIVDALDNFHSRLLLADVANKLGIPLVYAAIAGFTGQVMTIMPGDRSLGNLYKVVPETNRGVEVVLGNPSATPALAASLQVQEVVKIITGIGEILRNKMLYFDTELNIFDILNMK
jgi:molybdopterin-synthase adenylyltransferase